MAMTQQQRDQRRREKDSKSGAEDMRLKARNGEKKMIQDIMEWTEDKEQASAIMFCIRHMHSLGREGALLALSDLVELHKREIPESWRARFEEESRREALRNPGDEILRPNQSRELSGA
ncbi:hypothetical protein ACIPL1_24960 [Pseudomonas sp. NPDC090202]|uniref:hypothetical protein n=1 Tax=Pseudomonas sp. NPDC090202 TaxID=3364476 RepID=UPI0037FBD197